MEPLQLVALEAAVRRARERWPGIRCGVAELDAHLQSLGDALGDIGRFGDELHLACACCHGDPAALRALESEYISRTGNAVARLKGGVDFTDEVTQSLRHKLLLPPEPRLASYSGTGPLLGWLRVVILRLGLDLRRGEAIHRDQELAPAFMEQAPPEMIDTLRYQSSVAAAIQSAFAQLLPDERNLLRLHYLDGVSLDQLGVLQGVHRATIARQLAKLRQRVMKVARRDLVVRHRLTHSELRSVFRRAISNLDAAPLFARAPDSQ